MSYDYSKLVGDRLTRTRQTEAVATNVFVQMPVMWHNTVPSLSLLFKEKPVALHLLNSGRVAVGDGTEHCPVCLCTVCAALCCSLQRIKLHCFELLSIGVSRPSADVITEGITGEAVDREVTGTWRPAERLELRERRRHFIRKTTDSATIHCHSSFSPHSVFMCFVWISEQTAIISLYKVNWLVCITETECVYCAVRTEYLYRVQVNVNL
jgi:hypothetical protein